MCVCVHFGAVVKPPIWVLGGGWWWWRQRVMYCTGGRGAENKFLVHLLAPCIIRLYVLRINLTALASSCCARTHTHKEKMPQRTHIKYICRRRRIWTVAVYTLPTHTTLTHTHSPPKKPASVATISVYHRRIFIYNIKNHCRPPTRVARNLFVAAAAAVTCVAHTHTHTRCHCSSAGVQCGLLCCGFSGRRRCDAMRWVCASEREWETRGTGEVDPICLLCTMPRRVPHKRIRVYTAW